MNSDSTEFSLGDVVSTIASPSVYGAVIQVIIGVLENRYVVLQGASKVTYYASQLKPHQEHTSQSDVAGPSTFQAFLTAIQLVSPNITSLYSLNASRVDHIPYQFRPVLKFIRSDRPRLLIADEVGVGKTIEAGLIMRELQARTDVQSVLVICPKPLVTERKWYIEMKRFDEHFTHLDGKVLRYCIDETDLDGEWPAQYTKSILPFSLFNQKLLFGEKASRQGRVEKGLLDLEPPPHFDLIIVDEAHHLRNADTYVHQGVSFLCQYAKAVVFLTATPIQLGSNNLYVLLNLLRPDLIIDKESFNYMAEPNPHLNTAVTSARVPKAGWQMAASQALQEAARTTWGNTFLRKDPEFMRLSQILRSSEVTQEERIAFIHDVEQLHTFAPLINRTRRRDIGKFTSRKPETVTVEFTSEQRELHDALLTVQTSIFRRLHGDQNVKFMMGTICRQAASCLFGLAPFLRGILTRRMDELELVEIDESYEMPSDTSLDIIKAQIEAVVARAEALNPYDPKLQAMRKVIRSKQLLPNNKALLFTSFRHTLSYLYESLRSEGMRIGMVHGGTPEDERRSLRNRFSLPKDDPMAVDLLLSSEVGCEGLDYQFCDCLLNYDLPWNPMRVEQRIGRIDRYGQESETVAIYNFITPNTVDADIYERCLWRIGVFQEALGGSEEILGRVTQEIRDVAENLNLSPEERVSRLQQLADNEIRLIREQNVLEEQQAEFFGIHLPLQHDQSVADASNHWLSPAALQRSVENYLKSRSDERQAHILGEKELKTLRLNQEVRTLLLEDFKKLPRRNAAIYREWERWLKGNEPTLRITFDAVAAKENRDVSFLTPVHPLVQQAAHEQVGLEPLYTICKVRDTYMPQGSHPFAVYQWKKRGVREDVSLQPVCTNTAVAASFLELLERAEPVESVHDGLPDQNVFDQLDREHYNLWAQRREEHKEQTQKLALHRLESLSTSHRAHLALLHEQLASSFEENIQRMRRAQISRAESDYGRRKGELERLSQSADIIAQPVAFGLLVVEGA